MHQWIIGTPTTFPVVVYVSVYKENEQMVGEKILQMELAQQHYNQSLDTLLLRALKQQRDLVLRIHKKKKVRSSVEDILSDHKSSITCCMIRENGRY